MVEDDLQLLGAPRLVQQVRRELLALLRQLLVLGLENNDPTDSSYGLISSQKFGRFSVFVKPRSRDRRCAIRGVETARFLPLRPKSG